jgi:hypothetical protein
MAGTFPAFPGLDIRVLRSAVYATGIQTSSSGVEVRASFQSTPRYRYELAINFLRNNVGELASLYSFIDTQRGSWDTFAFTDPVDGLTRSCRFDMDEIEFERVVDAIWGVKNLKLISVK